MTSTAKIANGLGLCLKLLASIPLFLALIGSFFVFFAVSLLSLKRSSKRYTDYAVERRHIPRAPAFERRHTRDAQ
jgi:uncharacterized membrane protein